MNILKRYKGYLLIERYNRYYIRFYGGREENMPCEIPISEDDAKKVLISGIAIQEIICDAKKNIKWIADSFYEMGIIHYLIYEANVSELIAQKWYKKFYHNPDIRNEFYDFIMTGSYPSNPVKVEGFTAKELASNYPLSVVGAYNYLIYLREKPIEALNNLAKGLPIK